MMNKIAKILVLAISAGLYLSFHLGIHLPAPSTYRLPATIDPTAPPRFQQNWVSYGETQEAHSASIAILETGEPVTVWYGGTEEGHADVALFISILNDTWSPATVIADRLSTETGLSRYIRKVGNPAIHVWPDGNLGVFFVSVSVGGWGASAINYIESGDNGVSWTKPRRLVTSPFLNISTLVRTNAVDRTDGTIELPVYHEFAGKFSESLVISRDLRVIDKRRISWGKDSLQPAIAPLAESNALALLRYAGNPPGRVWSSTTSDSGSTWTPPTLTDLANPNAAVALLNTGDGNLLLALNDTEDGRNRLSLATRTISGETWAIVKTLESQPDTPEQEFEFSYPSMVMDKEQNIHLVYTWNQKRIRHAKFNLNWVNNSQAGTL